MRASVFSALLVVSQVSAWAPRVPQSSIKVKSPSVSEGSVTSFNPFDLDEDRSLLASQNERDIKAAVLSTIALGTPTVASAAQSAVPAAFAAYGHYLSLLGMLACVMIERLTIRPNMSEKEEDLVAFADAGFGVWGVIVAYTGYLRTFSLEKGFDFYAHEPIFWLKIAFVGVFGAASFFNTTQVIKRAVARRNGEFEPMSEALAKRMIQICNAELTALAVIPLTATLMARGVYYSQSIPWEAEAGLAAVVFAGLSYKYLSEAFAWEEKK